MKNRSATAAFDLDLKKFADSRWPALVKMSFRQVRHELDTSKIVFRRISATSILHNSDPSHNSQLTMGYIIV
jgi:hypothetical protein